MQITHNESSDKFDILELTKEELAELGDAFDYCPLPLKRKFYNFKTNIGKILA
jgi:hypothetical protein